MNSKTLVFSVTTILSASALFAEPRVDQSAVTLAQDSQSRLVTVGYELTGEPAVVTIDFQTNTLANAAGDWVSIGDVNFTNVIGDVNQVVQIGSHAIYWQPDKSWPDQRINDGRVRAVVKAWATNAPPDYCVVCLLTDAQMEDKKTADVTWNIPRRRYFVSADAVPGGVQDAMYKTQFLVLRKIPAAGVVWRRVTAESDKTQVKAHKVMLTRDYYIGVYEMTVGQHSTIGGTPGTSRYPQSSVTWNSLRGANDAYPWPDANGDPNPAVLSTSTIGKLRTRSGIDSFDLPTEAQWEYACRAGRGGWSYNDNSYPRYASGAKGLLQAVGWFNDNWSSGGTRDSSSHRHVVGEKPANAWGLYDTLGNVREWTLNWHGSYPTPSDPDEIFVDPIGPATGSNKVMRGSGAWDGLDWQGLISYRHSGSCTATDVTWGYRVLCDAVAK